MMILLIREWKKEKLIKRIQITAKIASVHYTVHISS